MYCRTWVEPYLKFRPDQHFSVRQFIAQTSCNLLGSRLRDGLGVRDKKSRDCVLTSDLVEAKYI